MLNQKIIEEVSAKLKDVLGQSPAADIEKNLRAVLQSVFAKLDLVTREEFDVQQAVLLRTREKLEALETKVAALEASGIGRQASGKPSQESGVERQAPDTPSNPSPDA
jgi:BMFP domain-containing protein YqiC